MAKGSAPGGKARRGRGRAPAPEPGEEPGEVLPADLDILQSQITLEPGQAQAGERARLQVPVRNLGPGATENATLSLTIPAWGVRAEQRLSLAAREGAVVEFIFDLPTTLAAGPVSAQLAFHGANPALDPNRSNNRAVVRNLLSTGPAGSPAAGPATTRGSAEFGLGECVSFRLDTAGTGACEAGGDFQLSARAGRVALEADSVRDLGPVTLTGVAVPSARDAGAARAVLQVGHVYEISNGARRAQVRVLQMAQSTERPKRGRRVPAAFDRPRINDPFRLPDQEGSVRRGATEVRVELEWVILP